MFKDISIEEIYKCAKQKSISNSKRSGEHNQKSIDLYNLISNIDKNYFDDSFNFSLE